MPRVRGRGRGGFVRSFGLTSYKKTAKVLREEIEAAEAAAAAILLASSSIETCPHDQVDATTEKNKPPEKPRSFKRPSRKKQTLNKPKEVPVIKIKKKEEEKLKQFQTLEETKTYYKILFDIQLNSMGNLNPKRRNDLLKKKTKEQALAVTSSQERRRGWGRYENDTNIVREADSDDEKKETEDQNSSDIEIEKDDYLEEMASDDE